MTELSRPPLPVLQRPVLAIQGRHLGVHLHAVHPAAPGREAAARADARDEKARKRNLSKLHDNNDSPAVSKVASGR